MRSAPAWFLVFALSVAGTTQASAFPEDPVAEALKAIDTTRRSGDFTAAAAAAADLVAKHPESLDAHVAHQDLQLALGHEKEILDVYRNAAKAPDASADAHYLCGRLLRGGPAIAEFRAALKADPAHFWAACNLGVELTRTKAWAEAKTTLEDAAKRRPDSAIPVNALGRLEEARGKNADAEKYYAAAVALDPSMTVARVNLGMMLVAQGKKDDAMKALQDAAARAPKDPMPLLAIGMAFRAAKDEKSALEAFQRAAAAETNDVASMNLVASAFLSLDKPDLAEVVLQRALKAAPGNATTKTNLAFVRVKKEEFDQAVKFATSAIESDDSCAEAHYVLALAYDHMVQPKKAEPEYRRAAELDKDNPAFARACAAFAASQGDWTRAISEYSRAVKLSDEPNEVLMELAAAYSGAQKPGSAASTYEQIVAADPNLRDAWLQLGIVCARDLKQTKRASKAFHTYVDRGGKDPRVAGWIAQLDGK
jgi:tetratricopeptide (TPR) repeat protein